MANLFCYLSTLIRSEIVKRHRERVRQERIAAGMREEGRPRFRNHPRPIDRGMNG